MTARPGLATKIEEIIADALGCDSTIPGVRKAKAQIVLTALNTYGLAVLPIKATEQMARDALPEGLQPIWYPMFAEAYEKVGTAFDPQKWEPEE